MSAYWLSRAELLLQNKIQKLEKAHVAIVGLGGIGGFAVECLVRAGIGELTLIDGDAIEASNRNRQVIALTSNDGKSKVLEMSKRCLEINPKIKLNEVDAFLTPANIEELGLLKADIILDCIDTLTPKCLLIEFAKKNQKPIISCLGAGGKLDPSQVQIEDISKTYNCTLARAVRKRLYKLGIRKGVLSVFSPEPVDKSRLLRTDGSNFKKSSLGTISYMPPLFGLYASSAIIRELVGDTEGAVKLKI
tara:strand:- start:1633 stop:2376 length:744 start_codon:yes stop_codon:yes gene_type:complete